MSIAGSAATRQSDKKTILEVPFRVSRRQSSGSARNLRSIKHPQRRNATVPRLSTLTYAYERSTAVSRIMRCEALIVDGANAESLDLALNSLQLNREVKAVRLIEQGILIQIALAQYSLGRFQESLSTARECIKYMHAANAIWNPRFYGILVRAQLALEEPTSAIRASLDEYAALIARTGFNL